MKIPIYRKGKLTHFVSPVGKPGMLLQNGFYASVLSMIRIR